MKRWQNTLLLVALLVWVAPAPAQSIFAKKTKPNPTQRVPELILILKTDPDERKRLHAAEEIRDYDATTFTEIVPVLVDVVLHDKKVNVRHEAVNSLGKIRPVNALAGHALEKAAADDESWRGGLQAKTVLTKYHLAGYSAKKTAALPTATAKTTQEPPLADAPPPVSIAPPRPLALPATGASYPRPLPAGAPPANPPPLPTVPTQGPSLFP